MVACGSPSSDVETAELGSSGGEDDWGDWGEDDEPQVESHHGAIELLGITPPEDKPWEEMNAEEREWYMIGKVLPIMKEVFADYDSERFAPSTYGCETCHGEEGEQSGYVMPFASAYPVPEPGTEAYATMENIFGDMVTFMEDQVTPTMGTLVGNDAYTCNHCHPSAGR